jgi:hypothetical protein
MVGVVAMWVPFAAFAILALLVMGSSPGLGGSDRALVALGFLVAVVLPLAARLALRRRGVAGIVVLTVLAVSIPLLWASLMKPDYSDPLHWITVLAAIGGALIVVGALLIVAPARRPHRGDDSRSG